jgi:CRISPR-associated protein Csx17
MTGLVEERLSGCTADSLDSYLRGVGFFLLAGNVEPSVRAWWDEEGVMWLASPGLEALAASVAKDILEKAPSIRTPWRGEAGRGKDFALLRNAAAEEELDWFDSCALPRLNAVGDDDSTSERSDHDNNPSLGEGASFGRGEIATAHQDALERLRKAQGNPAELSGALIDLTLGRAIESKAVARLTTRTKALGAYQSGRATGPGLSAHDVKPTDQHARTSAWDVVLILRGLRAFRGVISRRPEPGARIQASFPMVVRSRPAATGPEGVIELREDPPRTFELLAPLWSTPCTSRSLRHLLTGARLRTRRGVGRDTLDAVLIQAAAAASGLGFDRLVRFAFVPVDPRKPARYAVRRGEVRARNLEAARRALEEIVVRFLRPLEREVRAESAQRALLVAQRRLEDVLAGFGQPLRAPGHPPAREAQEALISVALLETPAARAAPDLAAPRLSSAWFCLADDRSAEFRLARSLVAGFSDARASLVRETLLPQRRAESGQFVLDATRTPPELERVADPLAVLVELVLAALRRTEQYDLTRAGSTPLDALAALLSGALGGEGERRLALLAAALAGIHPSGAPPAHEQDPAAHGLGADVARLLLAAQSAEGEDGADTRALERAAALASLLLAGRTHAARIAADRELRRRGLELLPTPAAGAPSPRPALLALAVLLPLDERARASLERVVALTPIAIQEGGFP